MFMSDTRHRSDVARVSRSVLAALKPSFPLSSVRSTTARRVWRHVLEEALADPEQPSGWRRAEKAVQALYQVARWYEQEYGDEERNVAPRREWRARLREEWETAFARRLSDPKALRHSREETSRLFSRLGEADPRLALEIEVGAELRPGQVIRSMRSQLDLNPVGAFACGKLQVAGKNKKRGEVVHLDPEQRAFVDRCLGPGGHLEELEAAFQNGRIEDYCLFQKGRIHDGRIPLERHITSPGPIELASMIALFKQHEARCGVEHVLGRSFYGLRRILTDIAPDYTSDPRELDRMTGHEGSDVRERVYQDRMREEFREGAAVARRDMRADLVAGRPPPRRKRIRAAADADGKIAGLRASISRVAGVELDEKALLELARELGLEL